MGQCLSIWRRWRERSEHPPEFSVPPLESSEPRRRRSMHEGKGLKDCDVEIFLMGPTAGHGRRTTGNTILVRHEFKLSGMRETRSGWTDTGDMTIKVANFPSLLDKDSKLGSMEYLKQTEENFKKGFYVRHCPKGFHALVLVLKYGSQFSEQEKKAVTLLKGMFGDDITRKHCILVFTHGENFLLENPKTDFDKWCKKQTGDLRQLIVECSNRVVLFHNMTPDKADESNCQLIAKVRELQGRYTKEMFEKNSRKRSEFITKKAGDNNNIDNEGIGANKSTGNEVEKTHEIDYDRITLGKPLGAGSFGSVFEGKLDGKKKVAIKEFKLKDQKTYDREVLQLFRLKHPNIVEIYGAARHSRYKSLDPDVYLVMELADNGTVYDALDLSKPPGFRDAISWGHQCAEGVAYLHSQSVVHRDLKPENCLLFKRKTLLKITDFGLSREITQPGQSMTIRIGSPLYVAPEVLHDKHYTEKCDVYGWAIMMWEIITCDEPFGTQDAILAKGRGQMPVPIPGVPDDLNNLMTRCWSKDPAGRPTMEQVVQEMKALMKSKRR